MKGSVGTTISDLSKRKGGWVRKNKIVVDDGTSRDDMAFVERGLGIAQGCDSIRVSVYVGGAQTIY